MKRWLENFRRKIWLKVYLVAGKRVDADEYWDPIFKRQARKRLREISHLYGFRLARTLDGDRLADYAGRDLRDGRRELRDSPFR